MRPCTLALAFLAGLTACQPGQDQHPRTAAARAAGPAPAVAAEEVAPTVVQLAEVDRLTVALPWPGPGAPRAARVDVTSPRGRLYAQLPVNLQLDTEGAGTATAVLEVRGTPIDGYHLVGTWTFALVDDGGAPVAVSAIDLE